MDNIRNNRKKTLKNIFKNSENLVIFTKDKTNYLYNKKSNSSSNENLIQFSKLLGKSNTSRDGEVYEIIINNIKCAIKIVPQKKIYNNNEIKIMETVSKFVENNICPNFNLFYTSFVCNHNSKYKFKNENIKNIINELNHIDTYNKTLIKVNNLLSNSSLKFKDYKNFVNIPKYQSKIESLIKNLGTEMKSTLDNYKNYNKNSIVILSELSDIDLNTFLSNNKNKKNISNILTSLVHQIILSLRFLNHNKNILHLDLHTGNILLNKIRENGYWHYQDIVDNKEYANHYVMNEGYQVKIADFGRSYIIDRNNSSNNDAALSKVFKQLVRFFPMWFGDETYDNFKKLLIKANNYKDIGNWCFYFDVWRILSSFYNSIEKNNIKIDSNLEEYFVNILQIMEQFIIQIISPLNTEKKKNISNNKKNNNDVSLYEISINLFDMYFLNKKSSIEKKIKEKKINIINKKIYKYNFKK
jgi:hypothetical protein